MGEGLARVADRLRGVQGLVENSGCGLVIKLALVVQHEGLDGVVNCDGGEGLVGEHVTKSTGSRMENLLLGMERLGLIAWDTDRRRDFVESGFWTVTQLPSPSS